MIELFFFFNILGVIYGIVIYKEINFIFYLWIKILKCKKKLSKKKLKI